MPITELSNTFGKRGGYVYRNWAVCGYGYGGAGSWDMKHGMADNMDKFGQVDIKAKA